MKTLCALSCVAVFAFAQTSIPHSGINIRASRYATTGKIAHLTGVVIETDLITLQADTVDYDNSTGEITAHGNVRIHVKQPPGNSK
jgi:lipopolysaccharide assembly outer membrane protein LptD (OstA)